VSALPTYLPLQMLKGALEQEHPVVIDRSHAVAVRDLEPYSARAVQRSLYQPNQLN
jgi:hypothetical protein